MGCARPDGVGMIPGIVAGQMRQSAPPASSYYDLVMSHSPLGYWRLGETSGPVAADASGNGRHGSFAGTVVRGRPSIIPSAPDNAALGCANTGYVDVTIGGSMTPVGKTFVCAVRVGSLATFSYLWHLGSYTSSNRGIAALINTDGSVRLEFFDGTWRLLTFPFVVALGTGYRLAFRINSLNSVSLFVNGVHVSTQTTPWTLVQADPSALRLGAATGAGSSPLAILRGDIDDVAVFATLLTDAEIAALEAAAAG